MAHFAWRDSAQRIPWASSGSVFLDLTTGGTFARSTEGSYLTGAPTDGSVAFLAWAAINARRIENRGDGLGAMLLMEGSRTNLMLQSRDLANATAWSLAGTAATTADAGPGPDGAVVADRVNAGVGQYSNGQLVTDTSLHVISGYGRAYSSTADWRPYPALWSGVVGTTWARKDTSSSSSLNIYPQDSTQGGGTADLLLDLWQLEDGAFPSSPIRTTTTAVTRGADVLTYAVGQYPASLLTKGFRVFYAPDCTDAEMIAAGPFGQTLLGFNGSQNFAVLAINGNTGGINVRIASQNAERIVGNTLTFSRGQLLTIDVIPATGTIIVSGATTGNGTTVGTPFSFDSGTLTVGSLSAGSSDLAFGRFAPTIVGL